MCGIMGYVGPREAAPLLLEGLRRLEYRGYDSAGIAVANGDIDVRKSEGKIERLAVLLDAEPLEGTIGIGHTRWATHGEPSDVNAHPHTDPSGKFVVVHNGIIENFTSLREMLEAEGHVLTSQTDTEILAHLVARAYDGDLVAAVRAAVAQAEGAYALVVMSALEPGRIVAVRRISPLVVGLGDGETFLASDIPAVLHHTRDFLIIEDGELVIVTADGATVEKIEGGAVAREPLHIEWDAAQAEKGGYDHFMLKEINEQPAVITETIAGRLDEDGTAWLEDVNFDDDFARIARQHLDHGLRHGLSRRPRRSRDLPAGAAHSDLRRVRPRDALRRSARRRGVSDDRDQPVGRDRRHAGGRPSRPEPRVAAAGVDQCGWEHPGA